MLEDFVKKVNAALGDNNIESAIGQLENLFTMADSELLSDVVLLSARNRKLRSDVRKGLLSYEQESIVNAQILDGLFSLVKEIKAQPQQFTRYVVVSKEMGMAEQKQNVSMSEGQRDAVMERMARVKMLQRSASLLWICDNPSWNSREVNLLESIGLKVLTSTSTPEARQILGNQPIDIIVSDINRQGNPVEGLDFLKELSDSPLMRPLIFYIADFDPSRGTPPYAFGITNWPNELLHLVMDIMERQA